MLAHYPVLTFLCTIHLNTQLQIVLHPSFCASAERATVLHCNADSLPAKERSFSMWDMVALWIGLVVCIPSWFLATSLVDLGARQPSAPDFAPYILCSDSCAENSTI